MKKKTEISSDQAKKTKTLYCSFEGCSQAFVTDYRLKIHLKRHLGIKGFECYSCGKKFSEKGNLKIHKRIHSGERPFLCTFTDCAASYKVYSHLKDHMNSRHLNQRNHVCVICSKSFYRQNALRNHIKVHTKSSSEFECGRCKEIFPSKADRLSHHMTKHSKNKAVYIKDKSECISKDLTDVNRILLFNFPEVFPETDDNSLKIWSLDMLFEFEEIERNRFNSRRHDVEEKECKGFLLEKQTSSEEFFLDS